MRWYVCVAGVWLLGVTLGVEEEDDGFGDGFLVDELSDQSNEGVFRPRSAKEAMRIATRLAQQDRSEHPGENYALLQDNAMGAPRGQRVVVYDAVDATTSRYNFPRSRRFRKVSDWPSNSRQVAGRPMSHPAATIRQSTPERSEPILSKKAWPQTKAQYKKKNLSGQKKDLRMKDKPWKRRGGKDPRRDFRRRRDKRQVDGTFGGTGFDLPPMANEDMIVKKKKKKRKKKTTTTESPVKKEIQKISARKRIYLQSEEIELEKAMGKSKGKDNAANLVKGLSKELDQLFKDMENQEEGSTSSPSLLMPTKEKPKFVPIPRNWQNPPSWKPPTRSAGVRNIPRGHWRHAENIITIGPQKFSAEKTDAGGVGDAVTEFDWKSYKHPLQQKSVTDADGLVLKPAPEDWPEPTHPSDGVYDWHKTQIRRGIPVSNLPRANLASQRYDQNKNNRWGARSTYTFSSWTRNKFTRGGRRYTNMNYVGYTPQTTVSTY